MVILQRGDHLPTVAGVQTLLNVHVPSQQRLEVDGAFGPLTEEAAKWFQREIMHARPTGIINGEVWRVLSQGQYMHVLSLRQNPPHFTVDDPRRPCMHDFPLKPLRCFLSQGPESPIDFKPLLRGHMNVEESLDTCYRGQMITALENNHGSPLINRILVNW